MKILLVTSEITYIPHNYGPLFEVLFSKRPEYFQGLVILKNLDRKTLKSIFGLKFLGANNIFRTLIQNIGTLPFKKRERMAKEKDIKTYYFKSMNMPEAIKLVKELEIDLIINLRTRCIYKKAILEAPKLGCINIHHGILPKYRGTMCDLYALSEGRAAGFTIHEMNKKIDAGKILKIKEVSFDGEKNYREYLDRTSKVEGETLLELIEEIVKLGKLPEGIPNTSQEVIFTKNPTRKQIKSFIKKGLIL